MASDLSSLLNSSRTLNSHLSRPDLPSVNLSLDQIEAQSRRLVSRQHGATSDADRANYLLAQAHVDAPALANSIAHLNTSTTFSPLQPLQDTDVAGYLRHAHEQNLISTIEEGRRETQEDFYRLLEERSRKDWEAKKRRVFEELGGRSLTVTAGTEGKALAEMKKSFHARGSLAASTGPSLTLQMQSKMMAYDRAVCELNAARLRGTSCPVIHILMQAAASLNQEGAREALEDQYWEIIERGIQARPMEARLGGDPSAANKIRAFLGVKYYKNGQWEDRIEIVAGQPLWAKLFYLVRTGHAQEALDEAIRHQAAIEHREPSFVNHFRSWVDSPDRRLSKSHRDYLQSVYNAHMLHAATADPFKLALYKLMGRLEPSRRSVPYVTATIEDWLWFQLAMVDEEEEGGLRSLTEVLLGYGEHHFEAAKKGVWASVLLMCGQFERAVAALWEHPETEIEAVHLAISLAYHGLLRVPPRAETSDLSPLTISPVNPPALSLSTLIWRYVRQFVKMDAKEALQYVYCVCLAADQGNGVGKETLESAWELVRRIIVLAHSGPAWDELVGGFRPDGTKFNGVIEQGALLLHLQNTVQFNEQILIRAARECEENDRISEAIKLYNLAGDYATVIACLAQALGNTLSLPTTENEKGKVIEKTAVEILKHYERMNRAVGRDREAAVRLLRVREAINAKNAGRPDVALEIMESTDLIPLDGDVAKITRRAEEFKDLHDALQRNLQVYLPLTMDCLAAVHQSIKNSSAVTEATRQMTTASLRKKSRSVMIFAGILKYRMSPDVYSYLARLDVEISL
ncbi:hypothetical protein ID866_6679 [Astraeus odoratus]|nr:hypothetical protein ID866_6679 [Astraeus odoratus]